MAGRLIFLALVAFSLSASTLVAADMMVIGAGQGRTGTDSLRIALNNLGVGPAYHMSQLLGIGASRPISPLEMLGISDGHTDKWTELELNASSGVPLDWSFVTEDYRSTLDQPAATYFSELLEANPNAKVILTVRPPDAVQRSSRDSWCRLIGVGTMLDRFAAAMYALRPYGWRFFRMHDAMGRGTARALGEKWSDFRWRRVCEDEHYGVAFFEAWNEHVRKTVPAEQLLEFETGKHGYLELARFLELSDDDISANILQAPYPRTNAREEFAFVSNIMRVLAVLTSAVPAIMVWCCFAKRTRGENKVKAGV